MNSRFSVLSLIFAFLLFGCEKDESLLKQQNAVFTGLSGQILSCWVNPQYGDSITTYERADRLDENAYGFRFGSDYSFIERKNSGDCGTPPITYADFEGTWELSDSTIIINTTYWGGSVRYVWKIASINVKYLKFITVDVVYTGN